MPNLLCEWIFPSDAPLSATYEWLHASERPGMTDYRWNRISYFTSPGESPGKGRVNTVIEFFNLSPWETNYPQL